MGLAVESSDEGAVWAGGIEMRHKGEDGMSAGPARSVDPRFGTSRSWPLWARWAASMLLLFHLASQVVIQFAPQPASLVETSLAGWFSPYYELFDLGHAYRYYAPEPGPTPVIRARLRFDDGRPDLELRLPDRDLSPRLRYQRHLNLANHLFVDFQGSRPHEHGPGEAGHPGRPSRWAASYARHLCRAYSGCVQVSLYAQRHLLPGLDMVYREGLPDFDDERFYEVPVLIGEYSCDDF
jgi:hypothetical protein